MVGRTNQEPESCKPLKPNGNVRAGHTGGPGRRSSDPQGGGAEGSLTSRGEEAGEGPMGRGKGTVLFWGNEVLESNILGEERAYVFIYIHKS